MTAIDATQASDKCEQAETSQSQTAENKPPSQAQEDVQGNEPSKAAAKTLEEQLGEARSEAQGNFDRLLRNSAEFENYKKRATRQMDEFRKFANESLVKALLPVVDNLERAIASSGEDQKANSSILDGLEMTLKEMLKILEKFNVQPIESKGKAFDPSFHQAVMQEFSDDCPENAVVTELSRGYLIHDRLLRPAMVTVSKGPEPPQQSTSKH
jgi:molecular chaperone GrpE